MAIIGNAKETPLLRLPFRLEQIGLITSLRRKAMVVAAYNRKAGFRNLRSPADYIDTALNLSHTGAEAKKPITKASLLWRLERLAGEAAAINRGSFLLRHPEAERFKPILHVGWGMNILAETGLDYDKFSEVINTAADPRYRLLAVEPAGVMLVAAGQRLKSRLIGIRLPQNCREKRRRDFAGKFTAEEEIRMISHGYGRGLYFQALTLRSALKEAQTGPPSIHPGFAVRGVGFAFAIVNISSLVNIWRTAARWEAENPGRKEPRHFNDGIISALSFLEWNFPGLLDSFEEGEFIQSARRQVRIYEEAGGVFSL